MCNGTCVDLKTDINNCGKCGTVCPMGATCVQGSCQCPSGQTRCGMTCVDTKSDNVNCGKCGVICGQDAGAISGGGMWACTNGACSVTCPQPKSACDNACFDLKADNDNCGSCGNACVTMTEQCMDGQCCKTTEKVCNGACTDVQNDADNCGMCGMKCPMNAPFCGSGKCTSGVQFSEAFTTNQASPAQCTKWNTFRASLSGNFTSVTIKGTNDMNGATCTGAVANTFCQALKNNTTTAPVSCGGRTWATGQCGGGIELTAAGSVCQCNSGYTVRPCINNPNWGGVNGPTCSAASQTITVICQ